jgi:hypothetical protein
MECAKSKIKTKEKQEQNDDWAIKVLPAGANLDDYE